MKNKDNQAIERMISLDFTKLDSTALKGIVDKRIRKNKSISMKYFWPSLTMQLIVYSFLTHVIIKYLEDSTLVVVSLLLLVLYLPFTYVLFRDFKKLATLKYSNIFNIGSPVSMYVEEYYDVLKRFYRFKLKYEVLLITISLGIMTWTIIRIYFSAGIMEHPLLAALIFFPSLICCGIVIRKDNKQFFQKPLNQLKELLSDLNEENKSYE